MADYHHDMSRQCHFPIWPTVLFDYFMATNVAVVDIDFYYRPIRIYSGMFSEASRSRLPYPPTLSLMRNDAPLYHFLGTERLMPP